MGEALSLCQTLRALDFQEELFNYGLNTLRKTVALSGLGVWRRNDRLLLSGLDMPQAVARGTTPENLIRWCWEGR